MKEFTFSVPQKITVGEGSLKKLPQISREQGGTHAFIISGPHLFKMGVVDSCAAILTEAGIPVSTFTETEGNPSVETVDAAVAKYQESGADFLIALGGGSPMDVAKAVGVVAKFGGSITDYEGGGKVPGDIPPLIAIPTTAGTGSEVTAFSVITDHERNYKLTVSSEKLIPSAAILDAELLTTLPASVAASCGVDALVHAIEAYLSKASSPFSDAMAEKALSLLGENICAYVADRSNIEAAENMLVGSLFAGIAFSAARLGDVHAMSHPVSAYYNVPHGVANAILLPFVMEYNALADRGKYLKIYNAISDISEYPDTFVPHMLVRKIRQINQKLGIPETLSEVGVTEEHFDAMADDAMKSGNIAVNPRSTGKNDILVLYRKAL
jgi:alcohol dehydrogenase